MKTTTKLLATLGIAGLAGLCHSTCQAADAFQTKINPKDGAEMVLVPAGAFKMGMDPMPMDQEQREQVNTPKHVVTLDGYWIYKYPVTVKQYKQYLEANKDRKPFQHFTGQMPPEPLWGWKDDHPMVNVTLAQAEDYAKWAGAALPTEAQWEKAARGTDERLYPWGNNWDPDACVHSSKVFCDAKGTRPVGSCPKNVSPYGAMDMAGNVWQWCDDNFRKDWYIRAATTNPKGPPDFFLVKTEKNPKGDRDNSRGVVTRGGSWALCAPKVFQTVNRDFYMAGPRGDALAGMDTGFRCVVPESSTGNSAKTLPNGTLVEEIAEPAKVPAHATSAQPVKPPTPAGGTAETEYLYTGDFQTSEIHKISTADGSYECFVKRVEGKGGTGAGCEFDSHGNLFSIHGPNVVKITPDKTVTVILTGLGNGFDMTVDSNDNLILGEYAYAADGPHGKLFKVEAKNLVPDKLPIKIEYAKDASGKPDYDKYTITPEGSMTALDGTLTPYGMSYDRNGNVYVQRLCGPFFKYDAPGKKTQMCKTALTYWQRTPLMDANGDFYVFGGEISKVTPDGRVIARMAPGYGWNHTVGIVIDSKGNMYQTNPGHVDGNRVVVYPGVMYKYTPDGQRSVLCDHVGVAPFWIAIWPRAKFPADNPTK